MGHLQALHRQYGDRAAFLFVYVTEANHAPPESGPLSKHDPRVPLAERRQGIREILEEMAFPFPCLFDRADGQVQKAYKAWPQRLVIIGVDGRVVFDGGSGLQPRWDMDEVAEHLRASLSHGTRP